MYPHFYYRPIPETSEPDWHLMDIGPVIDQARIYLCDRNDDELMQMTTSINKLLGRNYWPAYKKATEGHVFGDIRHIPGPALGLWQRMEEIDLADCFGSMRTSWTDIFAAIALLASMRLFTDSELVDVETWTWEKRDPPRLIEHADTLAMAKEAISFATACFDTDPKMEKERTKKLESDKRRTAALKGHALKHAIHVRFQAFWVQHKTDFRYRSDAAWQFYRGLSRTEKLAVSKKTPDPKNEDAKKALRKTVVNNLVSAIKGL